MEVRVEGDLCLVGKGTCRNNDRGRNRTLHWKRFLDLLILKYIAQTRFLLTGGADNAMKLWEVKTGECLYTWEFLTAVKRVAWKWVLFYARRIRKVY